MGIKRIALLVVGLLLLSYGLFGMADVLAGWVMPYGAAWRRTMTLERHVYSWAVYVLIMTAGYAMVQSVLYRSEPVSLSSSNADGQERSTKPTGIVKVGMYLVGSICLSLRYKEMQTNG